MEETQVSFRSGDLTLEGLLANPGGNAPAAVVCHPHPLYGGSMSNNVVDAILAAMWQAGYATLRFNFRGVGASEGEHDGGPGEVDDAVAAMAFILAQPGVRKEGAVMAGYSFGAMVAVSAGYERAEIARIVPSRCRLRWLTRAFLMAHRSPYCWFRAITIRTRPRRGCKRSSRRSVTRRDSSSSPARIISLAAAKRSCRARSPPHWQPSGWRKSREPRGSLARWRRKDRRDAPWRAK